MITFFLQDTTAFDLATPLILAISNSTVTTFYLCYTVTVALIVIITASPTPHIALFCYIHECSVCILLYIIFLPTDRL